MNEIVLPPIRGRIFLLSIATGIIQFQDKFIQVAGFRSDENSSRLVNPGISFVERTDADAVAAVRTVLSPKGVAFRHFDRPFEDTRIVVQDSQRRTAGQENPHIVHWKQEIRDLHSVRQFWERAWTIQLFPSNLPS